MILFIIEEHVYYPCRLFVFPYFFGALCFAFIVVVPIIGIKIEICSSPQISLCMRSMYRHKVTDTCLHPLSFGVTFISCVKGVTKNKIMTYAFPFPLLR